MPERKPLDTDLLTARDIARDYGINQAIAESLLRQRDREGKVVRLPEFRRRFIARADIGLERLPRQRQSSGGTTCS